MPDLEENFVEAKVGSRPAPVLVVEDEKGIRDTIQFALEFEGYEVFAAGNGQEALHALQRIPKPGLILLDLMMPVMDGWGFIEEVKKQEAFAAIPVVAVSACSDQAKSIRVREVISKPVDLDALCLTVRKWCG